MHDVRRIDWRAWAEAPQGARDRAIEEGRAFLRSAVDVADSEAGASVGYSMLGHEGDLMLVHLRPTPEDLDVLERRFERTALAAFTERATSYVSVTEASGYSENGRQFIEGDLEENSGLANYMRSRLYPTIPDADHVCFYPMDKRRDPGYNWYDLPFEERAEHMTVHGDIGRKFAGEVTQMITGSIGLDDWEWGVTLWSNDLTQVKRLLYEMRFDPSSSKYAEFGPFYVGNRFAPADLPALLAGEPLGESEGSGGEIQSWPPTPEAASAGGHDQHSGGHGHDSDSHHDDSGRSESSVDHSNGDASEDDHPASGGGRPPTTDTWSDSIAEGEDMTGQLAAMGVRGGQDYHGDGYALLFETDRDARALAEDVEGLVENFDHYDTHEMTAVRATHGRTAVVSIWDTEDAAQTASGFLTDVEGVGTGSRGPVEAPDGSAPEGSAGGRPAGTGEDDPVRAALAEQDIYAGQPHGEDVYALVVYSETDTSELFDAVVDLRESFDHYDTHEWTAVYESEAGGIAVVVSLWDTAEAAETAGGFLTDLPGVVRKAGEGDGFGTMGMFYTVKQDYREEFVDTFGAVGDQLDGMDGHRQTALLVNHEDDNDMFIASRWDSREDAMAFFRSEEFRDTVEWGRDVLADTPRHVFLA